MVWLMPNTEGWMKPLLETQMPFSCTSKPELLVMMTRGSTAWL